MSVERIHRSPIVCGIPPAGTIIANTTSVEYYTPQICSSFIRNIHEPFFGTEVEVYHAVLDATHEVLYKASMMAVKLGCTANLLAMYCNRRKRKLPGIWQATEYVNNAQTGGATLKSGGYFLSLAVCRSFEEYMARDDAAAARLRARSRSRRRKKDSQGDSSSNSRSSSATSSKSSKERSSKHHHGSTKRKHKSSHSHSRHPHSQSAVKLHQHQQRQQHPNMQSAQQLKSTVVGHMQPQQQQQHMQQQQQRYPYHQQPQMARSVPVQSTWPPMAQVPMNAAPHQGTLLGSVGSTSAVATHPHVSSARIIPQTNQAGAYNVQMATAVRSYPSRARANSVAAIVPLGQLPQQAVVAMTSVSQAKPSRKRKGNGSRKTSAHAESGSTKAATKRRRESKKRAKSSSSATQGVVQAQVQAPALQTVPSPNDYTRSPAGATWSPGVYPSETAKNNNNNPLVEYLMSYQQSLASPAGAMVSATAFGTPNAADRANTIHDTSSAHSRESSAGKYSSRGPAGSSTDSARLGSSGSDQHSATSVSASSSDTMHPPKLSTRYSSYAPSLASPFPFSPMPGLHSFQPPGTVNGSMNVASPSLDGMYGRVKLSTPSNVHVSVTPQSTANAKQTRRQPARNSVFFPATNSPRASAAASNSTRAPDFPVTPSDHRVSAYASTGHA
jgi:hypothetical protein